MSCELELSCEEDGSDPSEEALSSSEELWLDSESSEEESPSEESSELPSLEGGTSEDELEDELGGGAELLEDDDEDWLLDEVEELVLLGGGGRDEELEPQESAAVRSRSAPARSSRPARSPCTWLKDCKARRIVSCTAFGAGCKAATRESSSSAPGFSSACSVTRAVRYVLNLSDIFSVRQA